MFVAMTVKERLVEFVRDPSRTWIRRSLFATRGMIYAGARYRCPCCGGSFRSFAGQHGILSTTEDGYCPRCNAKARHRRIWLYLETRAIFASHTIRLLEIAPWWSFARRFQRMPNIEFTGLDLERRGPHVTEVGNVTNMPLDSESFDVVICVHVLEHVDDDRAAVSEMYRVLVPGGWALVTVPLNLDGPTAEDPSITDSAERTRLFGEPSHVRLYGLDLKGRLEQAGFRVDIDFAADIPVVIRTRYGLRDDENIFTCTKPTQAD